MFQVEARCRHQDVERAEADHLLAQKSTSLHGRSNALLDAQSLKLRVRGLELRVCFAEGSPTAERIQYLGPSVKSVKSVMTSFGPLGHAKP